MQFTSTWADYNSIRKESGPECPTTIGEDPKKLAFGIGSLAKIDGVNLPPKARKTITIVFLMEKSKPLPTRNDTGIARFLFMMEG